MRQEHAFSIIVWGFVMTMQVASNKYILIMRTA